MVKTRFSPSPTGHLHVGGARTALYAWLFARRHSGRFVLRIEDTDQERSEAAYTDAILQAMDWLGLAYDEGPYYQSKRFARYQEVLQELIDRDQVYACSCSKERIAELRERQMSAKEKPRYDGHCRGKAIDPQKHEVVWRFKTPQTGQVSFNDEVYGQITVDNDELDDLILVRSDGVPTYNFTVMVDDHDMGITHVIRGDDHINNTPRQIHLYRALGWEEPIFCHVPMILGADKKRLSKRHGATSVMAFKEQGFLPQALINYLARLGWSHGDQEVFSIEQLVDYFDLSHLHRSPATFDMDKLRWLNQHYIQDQTVGQLAQELQPVMRQAGLMCDSEPSLEKLLDCLKPRHDNLISLAQETQIWYASAVHFDADQVQRHLTPEQLPILQACCERLFQLENWEAKAIGNEIKSLVSDLGVKFSQVGLPLRVALTGGTASPALDQTVFFLGRQRVQERLQAVIDDLRAGRSPS